MKTSNNKSVTAAIKLVQTLPAPGVNNVVPLKTSSEKLGKKKLRTIEINLSDLEYHHFNAKALAQNTSLEEEVAHYLRLRFPLSQNVTTITAN